MDSLCNIYNKSLIIIPDISGFTKFVNRTDIIHGQSKIAKLLESILFANKLELSVAEIEGDAILFYKFNYSYTVPEVIEQCKFMFRIFHRELKKISKKGICDCGACNSLRSLSLKFIVHSGQLCSTMINNYCKIFGLDLIIAHRLLKNNIASNEYILFTDNFLANTKKDDFKNLIGKKSLIGSSICYDELGKVNFKYIELFR